MNRRFSMYADIRYGIHSNIPFCCIVRFIWREKISKPDFNSKTQRIRLKYETSLGFQYVPCIFCLFFVKLGWQKPSKLHRCNYSNPKCVKERNIFENGEKLPSQLINKVKDKFKACSSRRRIEGDIFHLCGKTGDHENHKCMYCEKEWTDVKKEKEVTP